MQPQWYNELTTRESASLFDILLRGYKKVRKLEEFMLSRGLVPLDIMEMSTEAFELLTEALMRSTEIGV
jgi:hypothetical protein